MRLFGFLTLLALAGAACGINVFQGGVIPKWTDLIPRGSKEATSNVKFFHIHIPKTAGISFKADIRDHMANTTHLKSAEGCFEDSMVQGRKALLMLREPRSHVLSQYLHCTTASAHSYGFSKMPRSFRAWLGNWSRLRLQGVTKGFCCYNPVDLQSYRLTCPSGSTSASRQPRQFLEVDGDAAIRNMQTAHFVGLVEAYQESLCLLHAKMLGTLPSYCNCENPTQWSAFPQRHTAHGVTHKSIGSLTAEELQEIDTLTTADTKLYAAAVNRFEREVQEVEAAFKTKVWCRDLVVDNSILLNVEYGKAPALLQTNQEEKCADVFD